MRQINLPRSPSSESSPTLFLADTIPRRYFSPAMPSLHRAVSTLCAAYFAVSLAVGGIVLRAMWDSFVNTPIEVCVENADGSVCYHDTQSTVSVFSTTTPDKGAYRQWFAFPQSH